MRFRAIRPRMLLPCGLVSDAVFIRQAAVEPATEAGARSFRRVALMAGTSSTDKARRDKKRLLLAAKASPGRGFFMREIRSGSGFRARLPGRAFRRTATASRARSVFSRGTNAAFAQAQPSACFVADVCTRVGMLLWIAPAAAAWRALLAAGKAFDGPPKRLQEKAALSNRR